ncbi:unnamed protein product [Protopolystoma xenopodis]|uniref:Uncharacterized protein n=1 Tax=Protopolystoma xenopodis TaxID=117903 RepID=A0A448XAC7_9PLAT|nr:unnamed protein product [Protopolystoma xenopodis]
MEKEAERLVEVADLPNPNLLFEASELESDVSSKNALEMPPFGQTNTSSPIRDSNSRAVQANNELCTKTEDSELGCMLNTAIKHKFAGICEINNLGASTLPDPIGDRMDSGAWSQVSTSSATAIQTLMKSDLEITESTTTLGMDKSEKVTACRLTSPGSSAASTVLAISHSVEEAGLADRLRETAEAVLASMTSRREDLITAYEVAERLRMRARVNAS